MDNSKKRVALAIVGWPEPLEGLMMDRCVHSLYTTVQHPASGPGFRPPRCRLPG
jgi:hypothetical protein